MRRLLLILVGLLAFAPITAIAHQPNHSSDVGDIISKLEQAENRDEAFMRLSEEQQAAVITYFELAAIRTSTVFAPDAVSGESDIGTLASGCWYRTQYTWGENYEGSTLWTFYVTHYWCGDGYGITSAPAPQIQVSAPGWWWSYEGLVDQWSMGGVGWTAYRTYRQGEFAYCPVQVACIQHSYPWAEQQGSGDGSYWGTSGY